jgi:hypothetical protein
MDPHPVDAFESKADFFGRRPLAKSALGFVEVESEDKCLGKLILESEERRPVMKVDDPTCGTDLH